MLKWLLAEVFITLGGSKVIIETCPNEFGHRVERPEILKWISCLGGRRRGNTREDHRV